MHITVFIFRHKQFFIKFRFPRNMLNCSHVLTGNDEREFSILQTLLNFQRFSQK